MKTNRFVEIYASTDLDSIAECMVQSFTKKQIVNWIFENFAERLDEPYEFIDLIKKEIKKWDNAKNE